ncbi:MAG: helix-turn-helix transcriptional regulator [Bacteroidetes bacterium]|nr:helix-turn-helix transcriptional regulator [Bacteroidota bacterium]
MKSFGEFIKSLRIKNEITLREFCRQIKGDPSNWSKIERGKLPPPKSKKFLEEIAEIVKLKNGEDDYFLLFDLAALSFIPNDLIEDEKLLEKLPVFFRTLRGKKPSKEELEGNIPDSIMCSWQGFIFSNIPFTGNIRLMSPSSPNYLAFTTNSVMTRNYNLVYSGISLLYTLIGMIDSLLFLFLRNKISVENLIRNNIQVPSWTRY